MMKGPAAMESGKWKSFGFFALGARLLMGDLYASGKISQARLNLLPSIPS
jgi:hypothetical protein